MSVTFPNIGTHIMIRPGEPAQQATLCLPVEGTPPQRILLGYKKAGFGAGKVTAFGGKVAPGERVREAAVRELEEETGLRAQEEDLVAAAILDFQFPARSEWDQRVHLFLAPTWHGEPLETAEMAPAWFNPHQIPYAQMWEDAAYWLPSVLKGRRVRAHFVFQDDNETLESFRLEAWPVARPNQEATKALRGGTGIESVFGFLEISDDIGTAGQPTPEQFAAIKAAGYDVVVNLALPTSTNALPSEKRIVQELGMDYIHIPVVWEKPTLQDLEQFLEAMESSQGKRVFVHCAMNMRVSVFVLLYRVIRRGVPRPAASESMLQIWQPNDVWAAFIETALRHFGVAHNG